MAERLRHGPLMSDQFSSSTPEMVVILTVAAEACLQFRMRLQKKGGRLPDRRILSVGPLIVGVPGVDHQRIGVNEPPQPTVFCLCTTG